MKSFKRFFHSYKDTEYKDNTLLAYKKLMQGTIEIITWHGEFELYYRTSKKRYGYFIATFQKLERATEVMTRLDEKTALELCGKHKFSGA